MRTTFQPCVSMVTTMKIMMMMAKIMMMLTKSSAFFIFSPPSSLPQPPPKLSYPAYSSFKHHNITITTIQTFIHLSVFLINLFPLITYLTTFKAKTSGYNNLERNNSRICKNVSHHRSFAPERYNTTYERNVSNGCEKNLLIRCRSSFEKQKERLKVKSKILKEVFGEVNIENNVRMEGRVERVVVVMVMMMMSTNSLTSLLCCYFLQRDCNKYRVTSSIVLPFNSLFVCAINCFYVYLLCFSQQCHFKKVCLTKTIGEFIRKKKSTKLTNVPNFSRTTKKIFEGRNDVNGREVREVLCQHDDVTKKNRRRPTVDDGLTGVGDVESDGVNKADMGTGVVHGGVCEFNADGSGGSEVIEKIVSNKVKKTEKEEINGKKERIFRKNGFADGDKAQHNDNKITNATGNYHQTTTKTINKKNYFEEIEKNDDSQNYFKNESFNSELFSQEKSSLGNQFEKNSNFCENKNLIERKSERLSKKTFLTIFSVFFLSTFCSICLATYTAENSLDSTNDFNKKSSCLPSLLNKQHNPRFFDNNIEDKKIMVDNNQLEIISSKPSPDKDVYTTVNTAIQLVAVLSFLVHTMLLLVGCLKEKIINEDNRIDNNSLHATIKDESRRTKDNIKSCREGRGRRLIEKYRKRYCRVVGKTRSCGCERLLRKRWLKQPNYENAFENDTFVLDEVAYNSIDEGKTYNNNKNDNNDNEIMFNNSINIFRERETAGDCSEDNSKRAVNNDDKLESVYLSRIFNKVPYLYEANGGVDVTSFMKKNNNILEINSGGLSLKKNDIGTLMKNKAQTDELSTSFHPCTTTNPSNTLHPSIPMYPSPKTKTSNPIHPSCLTNCDDNQSPISPNHETIHFLGHEIGHSSTNPPIRPPNHTSPRFSSIHASSIPHTPILLFSLIHFFFWIPFLVRIYFEIFLYIIVVSIILDFSTFIFDFTAFF